MSKFLAQKEPPHKICLTSAMVIPECLSALKHKCLSVRVSEGVGSECSHSYCSTFLLDTHAQCAMQIAHCTTSYSEKKNRELAASFLHVRTISAGRHLDGAVAALFINFNFGPRPAAVFINFSRGEKNIKHQDASSSCWSRMKPCIARVFLGLHCIVTFS